VNTNLSDTKAEREVERYLRV